MACLPLPAHLSLARFRGGSRRPGRVILRGVDCPELERPLARQAFWRPRPLPCAYSWPARRLASAPEAGA